MRAVRARRGRERLAIGLERLRLGRLETERAVAQLVDRGAAVVRARQADERDPLDEDEREERAEAGDGAAVLEDPAAVHLADPDPEAVRASRRGDLRRRHLRERRRRQRPRPAEQVLGEGEKVVDAREEAATAAARPRVLEPGVALERRPLEPERAEDPLLERPFERRSGDRLRGRRGDVEPGARVREPRPRLDRSGHGCGFGEPLERVVAVAVVRERRRPLMLEPRLMAQALAERDGPVGQREPRQVPRDGLVEVEEAVLAEREDERRDERLRDRRDPEDPVGVGAADGLDRPRAAGADPEGNGLRHRPLPY